MKAVAIEIRSLQDKWYYPEYEGIRYEKLNAVCFMHLWGGNVEYETVNENKIVNTLIQKLRNSS